MDYRSIEASVDLGWYISSFTILSAVCRNSHKQACTTQLFQASILVGGGVRVVKEEEKKLCNTKFPAEIFFLNFFTPNKKTVNEDKKNGRK